jgi:hypothetical protein
MAHKPPEHGRAGPTLSRTLSQPEVISPDRA